MWARDRIILGKIGECRAIDFLKGKGYRIIERNYKTPLGEIDAVADEGGVIVFVETKTRISSFFGPPCLSVTWRKRKKLIKNALCYLARHAFLNRAWRIDVVSVKMRDNYRVEYIEVIKNAVEDEGEISSFA